MTAEWRSDDLITRRVIIAPERSARPHQLDDSPAAVESDPFLEGNESETTPEHLAVRSPGSAPNAPGWTVRVVPNRFPALQPESAAADPNAAWGIHDVVIECPQFETCLSRLDREHVRDVVRIWRDRLAQISLMPAIQSATFFKNKGAAAGASLAHCHSQIIALPDVPPLLQRELDAAKRFYDTTRSCAFADLLQREHQSGGRVARETVHFTALCPRASRFPGEVWILPRFAESHFENTSDAIIAEVADLLHWLLIQQNAHFDDPDYNIVLHSAPFHQAELPWFRWHFEIYTRISGMAGFETGTGLFINPVLPEALASHYRTAGP